jgi:hypothetical protein
MSRVEFETTIPGFERTKTVLALNRAAILFILIFWLRNRNRILSEEMFKIRRIDGDGRGGRMKRGNFNPFQVFLPLHKPWHDVWRRKTKRRELSYFLRQHSSAENDTCYVHHGREGVAKWIRNSDSLCTNTIHSQEPFSLSILFPAFIMSFLSPNFVAGIWNIGCFTKYVYIHPHLT